MTQHKANDGDATEAYWSAHAGREYTVSIAIPGSILYKKHSPESYDTESNKLINNQSIILILCHATYGYYLLS